MADRTDGVRATPAPASESWTNERCQYEVCDEAEQHDPKCKAWPDGVALPDGAKNG